MDKKKGIAPDRIIRGIIGSALLIAGFFDVRGAHVFFWTLGSVMLITAITGACAFGSSCAVEPVKVKPSGEEK